MTAPDAAAGRAPRQVFRQRSPVIMSVLFGVVGALLLVSAFTSWSTDPNPAFVAWMLFALAVIWAVFTRPSVMLDQRGVHLRNIVRDIRVPWPLVDDVEARWNIKVWVGEDDYTAWAISSQVDRDKVPPSGLAAITPRLGAQTRAGDEVKPIKGAITGRRVADAILLTRVEYDAAVEQGLVAPEPEPRVEVTWNYLSILLMALPLLAALFLAFG